jgi:presenilin-like A22 family membrane protease
VPRENRNTTQKTRRIALNEKHRASLIQLAPVLASILFGIICAVLISSTEPYTTVTPFSEGVGSLANAMYFVIAVGIGATIIYLLLKRKDRRLITVLIGFALTIAIFMLSFVYLFTAFSILALPYPEVSVLALSLSLSVVTTIIADVAIFRNHRRARNLTVLCLGGALGTFLGWSIPVLSAVLILIFLAVYDVYAVFYGPVGKIAESGLDQLPGLSFSFKDVQMGLGDLTFYSMLTSLVLINAGPVFCLASATGVLIGAFLAFKMLEKKGMFPGLPFPIALGLVPLIIFFFL